MKIIYFTNKSECGSKIEKIDNDRLLPSLPEYKYKKYRLFLENHNSNNMSSNIYLSNIDVALIVGSIKGAMKGNKTSINFFNTISDDDKMLFKSYHYISNKYKISNLFKNHHMKVNLSISPIIVSEEINNISIVSTISYKYFLFYHTIRELQPNTIIMNKNEVACFTRNAIML